MLPTIQGIPEDRYGIATREHLDILDKSINADWSTPEFKLNHFVGRAHIHPLHQVRQWMMELNARQEMIESYHYNLEQARLQIQLEEEKKAVAQFPAQILLHDLEIRQTQFKMRVTEEKLRSLTADRDKLFKLIEDFNASPRGRDASGDLYIDILNDPEKYNAVEKQYWEYRLAKQGATDMIAYGRIGVGNIDAILQLDADAQNRCLSMAYEILLMNEARMNKISDAVQDKLSRGETVSDILQLMEVDISPWLRQLSYEGKPDVPLIQKR